MKMDQLRLLAQLDRVAGACRRLGLSALPPVGKRLVKPLMQAGVSVTVDGFEITASLEHRHYLEALRKGEIESLMTSLFASAVRPGMTILDIGAFVGWYTLIAARQVGADGAVYAFEPDSRNCALLTENLLRNKLHERVVVVPKAVSNIAGARSFFLHGGDQSRSSLISSDAPARQVMVESLVLDDFFSPAMNADVIKIDIEGGEILALNGMERILRRAHRNLKLFVECNPSSLRLAGSSAPALIARLSELGFEISLIDESNRRLAPLDSRVETSKYVNLYCTRKN